MQTPRLGKWANDRALDGLLYFAQLVDEMLFDYSLDSHKLPAHNTSSRCDEVSDVIDAVKGETLQAGNVAPVVQELVSSLKDDPVAKELMGPVWEQSIELLSKNQSTDGVHNLASIGRVVNYVRELLSDYLDTTKHLLRQAVRNPKQKVLIGKLARSYVTELVHQGYSRQHIYYQTRQFFFDGPTPATIASPDAIEDFLNLFPNEKREWDVVFRVDRRFWTIRDSAQELRVNFSFDPPPVRGESEAEKRFLSQDNSRYVGFPLFVVFDKVTALDPHSARQTGERLLDLFSRINRFYVHRSRLKWLPRAAVYDEKGDCAFIGEPIAPVLVAPDVPISELPSLARDAMKTFLVDDGLESDSLDIILKALDSHSQAIGSRTAPGQLLLLWAALEALLPRSKDDARISYFCTALEPVLARRYIWKLVRGLDEDLKRCIPEVYRHVLASVSEGTNSIEKLAAILSIEDRDPERRRLYEGCNRNVLLCNRVYELSRALDSPAEVETTLISHIRRVKWHLQRIYRARNAFIHSAEESELIDVLVENLHSYVDLAVETVIEAANSDTRLKSTESVFLSLDLQYQAYLRQLSKAKEQRATINSGNYLSMLFAHYKS